MSHTSLLRLLFIGNSATYVHDIPGTLCRLAGAAGYPMETASVVKGGYTLTQHANAETDHGRTVFETVRRGFDIVFLQDNGNCVSSPEMEEASRQACRTLISAVRETGAAPYIYVRPPCLKDCYGYSTLEQCKNFDEIFGTIAKENGDVKCVYVNRAFAYAAKNYNFNLWGPDNAHTSPLGAYLIVCTFFATLFGEPATKLSAGEVDPADAKILAEIADKVVRENIEP